MLIRICTIAVLTLAFNTCIKAQVVINEIGTRNDTVLTDEFGKTPDWFELYNSGSVPVDLDNYYLTDDPNDTIKWVCPSLILAPGSYLVVFASGNDFVGTDWHTNFKLSSSGDFLRLSDENGFVIDSVSIPKLRADHSYGRSPNGTGVFRYFDQPTPFGSNITTAYLGYAKPPVFSSSGGFYNQNVNLQLTNPNASGKIYYSVNGDFPTDTSDEYSSPLQVTTSKPVTAVCYVPQFMPSDIEAKNYIFLSEPSLPVLCISTPPRLLWSDSAGIYIKGPNASPTYPFYGANFWQDWEIPVQVEYYIENGTLGFSQKLGMRIHGGSVSRTRTQKSFRFLAKSKYGDRDIDYPLFPRKKSDSFRRFVLRNSGGDFGASHMRDGLVHKNAIEGKLDVDVSDYRPVIVYLNGQYWGILNLREKIDEHYLESNYDIKYDSLDLLEEDTSVLEGSFDDFDTLHAFVLSEDLTINSNYEWVKSQLDISSFVDYFITELFHNNLDWPHNNLKVWRDRENYPLWRYILFDLDGAFSYHGWIPAEYDMLDSLLNDYGIGKKHAELFKGLLVSPDFKEYFITRYADLLNTVYSSESLIQSLEEQKTHLSKEMPNHLLRWGLPMADYYFEIDERIPDWMTARPDLVRNHIQKEFDLVKQVELKINVYPPDAGKIVVNTIEPEVFPWNGIYFDGVPVSLTAVANHGYTFQNWKSLYAFTQDDTKTLVYNYTGDDAITAYFDDADSPLRVKVSPNPAFDVVNVSFVVSEIGTAQIHLINALGQVVSEYNSVLLNAGVQKAEIVLDNVEKGLYFVRIQTEDKSESQKIFIKK